MVEKLSYQPPIKNQRSFDKFESDIARLCRHIDPVKTAFESQLRPANGIHKQLPDLTIATSDIHEFSSYRTTQFVPFLSELSECDHIVAAPDLIIFCSAVCALSTYESNISAKL